MGEVSIPAGVQPTRTKGEFFTDPIRNARRDATSKVWEDWVKGAIKGANTRKKIEHELWRIEDHLDEIIDIIDKEGMNG